MQLCEGPVKDTSVMKKDLGQIWTRDGWMGISNFTSVPYRPHFTQRLTEAKISATLN